MEAKEGSKTAQGTQNDMSSSVVRDSSPSRTNSTETTVARSGLNENKNEGPAVVPEDSTQSSEPKSSTAALHSDATVNEKATATVSAEPKPVKTGPHKTTHDTVITEPAHGPQHSLDVKMPSSDAGNDHITIDKSHKPLADSDGGTSVHPKEGAAPSGPSPGVVRAESSKPQGPTGDAPVPPPFSTSNAIPPTLATPKMENVQEEPPSFDEIIQQLRSPLVETYAPYIHPSDTSLTDARDRLRKALDQTRELREAFTDRVYKKYRVLLRPVPKSVDTIVDPINADPVAASAKLQEEIRQVKEEKDIEKKEIQKLASVKPPLGPDGQPLPNAAANTAEVAEQLAFIGAGLSLVVLPEEDVDENEIDLSQYKFRGPTNPETGQRQGGISAAAAAAAEVLLDRARRGGVLRMERQRRRQLQLLSGETPEADSSMVFPSLHLLSSSDPARRVPERPTPATAKAAKGSRPNRMSPPFPTAPSGGKSSRLRASASLSGSALLTLNPSAEELRTDGKPSAATAALISSGVGIARPTQQRWRHPHPESVGGRRSSLNTASAGKKGEISWNSPLVGSNVPEYLAWSLPPLPTAKERRESKPANFVEVGLPGTDRARAAVLSVLRQFVEQEDSLASSQNENAVEINGLVTQHASSDEKTNDEKEEASLTEKSAATETKESLDKTMRAPLRKRPATEIGLLRSLQYTPEQETKHVETAGIGMPDASQAHADGADVTASQGMSLTEEASVEGAFVEPIQPMLAFSVMHALGLVREAEPQKHEQSTDNRFTQIDPFILDMHNVADKETDTADKDSRTESSLKTIFRKMVSRKRCFSDAFLSSVMYKSGTETPADVDVKEYKVTMLSDSGFVGSNSPRRDEGGTLEEENATKKTRIEQQSNQPEVQIQADECPVVAIRGGGEEILDESDDNVRSEDAVAKRTRNGSSRDGIMKPDSIDEDWADNDAARTKVKRTRSPGSPSMRPPSGSPTSPSAHETSLHSQALFGDLNQQTLSLMHTRRQGGGSDALYSTGFSSPQNRMSPSLSSSNRHIAQQHANLHHSPAHALNLAHNTFHHAAINRHAHHMSGDLSDFYGIRHSAQRQRSYGSSADWSSLGAASAAAVGFLPSPSSLASMGLASHRAAMVGLSVRDRARALLAREQQQNAAVAAHAAAAHRHARIAELSLLGASPGGNDDLFSRSAGFSSRFSHSTAPAMSSPTRSELTGPPDASPAKRTSKSEKQPKESQPQSASAAQQKADQKTDRKTKANCPSSSKDGSDKNNQKGAPGRDDGVLLTKKAAGGEETNPRKRKIEESSSSKGSRPEEPPTKTPAKPAQKAEVLAMPSGDKKADDVKHAGLPTKIAEAQTSMQPEEEDTASDSKPEALSVEKDQQVGKVVEETTEEKATECGPPPKATSKITGGNARIPLVPHTSDESSSSTPVVISGMQFFVPDAPADMPADVSDLIVASRFHDAAGALSTGKGELSLLEGSTLVEYLIAVGAAVPIPKALVSNTLKERLNTPGFKNQSGNGAPVVPREVRR